MRAATRPELISRIARKRRSKQSIARDLVRLQDALHAELEAALDETQRAAARERREPGSFQREFELDD
ncbi:hypothetical protein [Methylopila sp. M107]|uniref:hypothetical protein n=1 Tax=Methylopila sp. M107 TaxID=1101190 RepID=UPI00037B9219|nr:hypothetical protein [Methylopila sp. M107]